MKISNWSFENVATVKYLGKRVINKNVINEEIKSLLPVTSEYFVLLPTV
jgi:hypothetical protein